MPTVRDEDKSTENLVQTHSRLYQQTFSSSQKCISFYKIPKPFEPQPHLHHSRCCLACDITEKNKKRKVRFSKLPPKCYSFEESNCSRREERQLESNSISDVSVNISSESHRKHSPKRVLFLKTQHRKMNPCGGLISNQPVLPELLIAAQNDSLDLVEVIQRALRGGFREDRINSVDQSGRTALSYIASNGNLAALEVLLQIPSLDCNKADNEGNTPLHFAAQAGQSEVLSYMLSRCTGLNVDARNCLGFTPLMKAALQGRTKCSKMLLFAGASPTLKDDGRGLRPAQWARFCGRIACADLIDRIANHQYSNNNNSNNNNSSSNSSSNQQVRSGGLLIGKAPPPPPPASDMNHSDLRSKLKKAFRSNPPSISKNPSGFSVVQQLTAAGLCAGTPLLPASARPETLVPSRIIVPRVQVTSPNGGSAVDASHDDSSMVVNKERILTSRPIIKSNKKKSC